jgi:2-polyprenyl-3-methyl-5-hydroxy-6-metoxy-1,4-benzoquinol methylase
LTAAQGARRPADYRGVPAETFATSPDVAAPLPGVRAATVGDGGQDKYYAGSRPDLRDMIPLPARRTLDVGCGAGALGAALKADRPGIEAVGIEVFTEAADLAETRLDRVLRLDLQGLTELPYDHGYFDAMTFGDVLEHMQDPHGLLRTLKRYLAPDGVIICSIPNVKHWSVVGNLLINDQWQYADSGLLDRTHVHFFTITEIGQMLDEVGFAVSDLVVQKANPMPEPLKILADVAAALGATDRNEALAQLEAYQYIFSAHSVR